MKKLFTLSFALLFTLSLLIAQKKPLDQSAIGDWKLLGAAQMSEDGKFALYPVTTMASDGYLIQSNLLNGSSATINRGKNPTITYDSKYGVCTIAPFYEDTRQAKIQKKKAEDMPKDSLCIWTLGQPDYKKFPNVSSYAMAKEGSLAVAFKTERTSGRGEGTNLMLYYFASGKIDTLRYVTDYVFNNNGTELFIIRKQSAKESVAKDGLYLYNLVSKKEQELLTGPRKARFFLPVSDKEEQFFAFYANIDTTKAAEKLINIYFFKKGDVKATLMADANVKGLPKDWFISPHAALAINQAGTRLFFGIAPKPLEKDTALIDFEAATLDVWHHLDDYLQPMQLQRLPRLLKESYLSYLPIQNPQSGLIQLATPDFPSVQVPNDYNSDWGYAIKYMPYREQDADTPDNLYVISIADGITKKIASDKLIGDYSVSPLGNYLCWYNQLKKAWFSYEVGTGIIRNLTDAIGVNFWDESSDWPEVAPPYGSCGWRENDAAFLVYDKYDIWEIDPSGAKSPVRLTDGLGRKQQCTFRILSLNNNVPVKAKETIYFTVFDNVAKYKGFYCKDQSRKQPQMQMLIFGQYNYQQLQRSKDGKVLIFTRENFTESPNLWMTRDLFKTQTRLSDINSQQKEYNWGTAELVSWTSANGVPCDGILFKPEDFDPSKKYPMIVYFYETISQGLYHYKKPLSSSSASYCVSNGYLYFTPDIHYVVGHPGQSAVDCIMSGIDMLCKNPWVDEKNMAISGISWGGYQTAYVITQTNRFKAAYAGCAQVNMISGYGSLRSGGSRQPQYECGQSRIGKTLWEGADLYIENSSIFHMQNVTTPLLLMHNDNDHAVPWAQAVECFTALRRLGKQVWMLNYNGEGHGLAEYRNNTDFSIRLAQFYDHFLKGAPAPVWLKEGIPAAKKGIDWGLGYDSNK